MRNGMSEIVFVLDKSGSMLSVTTDTIGSFNQFVEDQKRAPGEAVFSLVLFDHEYDLALDRVPIQNVKPLTGDTYKAGGNTALLDAIGRTVVDLGRKLSAMPEADRPEHVIFVILTDGEENASRDHTAAAIKTMIEEQTGVWKWKFIFLGANQDAFLEARQYGIRPMFTANYRGTPTGVRNAVHAVSSAVRDVRAGDISEAVATLDSLNSETEKLRGKTAKSSAGSVS